MQNRFLVKLEEGPSILDFGCGYGRFYNYFKEKNVDYCGIDISEAMIEEAEKRYPEAIGKFSVSEGEHLPFENNTFDIIACYGVFDACYQENALAEMLRVLDKDGYLMLTGKNDNYYEDDEQALVAERNARAKGHPNYFTDTFNMETQLENSGCKVVSKRYFLRRKDSPLNRYTSTPPMEYFTNGSSLSKRQGNVTQLNLTTSAINILKHGRINNNISPSG